MAGKAKKGLGPGVPSGAGTRPISGHIRSNLMAEAVKQGGPMLVGGTYDVSAPPPDMSVVMAVGVVPFKPLGSVPLVVWGTGPTGDARTFVCEALSVDGPSRENAKATVCQMIDNFFDAWEGAKSVWVTPAGSGQLSGTKKLSPAKVKP